MKDKCKVLVIDDNEETVAGLSSYLNQYYRIVSANDGLEGLQIFEHDKEGIDLVITDLVLPGISGVALIEVIKKKFPNTPIVAMTGWGHYPKALASEAKADMVLDKPFEMKDLHQALEKLSSKMHSNGETSKPSLKN